MSQVLHAKAWWLLAAAPVGVISGLWLAEAFDGRYVVEDDARQHVFWLAREDDRSLFQDDLITDYFASYAPSGYKLLYRGLMSVGLDPLTISKLLPVALLAVAAFMAYIFVSRITGTAAAAGVASGLLTLSSAQEPEVVSGTPRAFVYVLLLLSLCGAAWRRPAVVAVAIALSVALYPPVALLTTAAIAVLVGLEATRRGWSLPARRRIAWGSVAAAVAVAVAVATFAVIRRSIAGEYGPLVTAGAAREMFEFGQSGRSSFFYDYWHDRYLTGMRSGAVAAPLLPAQVVGALAFVLIMARSARWPLAQRWRDPAGAMAALLAASVALFVLAHVLLYDLYLPSRYTAHSLRLLTALAAGFAAVVVISRLGQQSRPGGRVAAAAVAVFVLGTTATGGYPKTLYERGEAERVYRALQSLSPDTLTASIASEGSNIPTFARRPVLASREYAIAYHTQYYAEIARRVDATVRAQYASGAGPLRVLASRWGVDVLVVDDDAFEPGYIDQSGWLAPYPATAAAAQALAAGRSPFVARARPECVLAQDGGVRALDVRCLLAATTEIGRDDR